MGYPQDYNINTAKPKKDYWPEDVLNDNPATQGLGGMLAIIMDRVKELQKQPPPQSNADTTLFNPATGKYELIMNPNVHRELNDQGLPKDYQPPTSYPAGYTPPAATPAAPQPAAPALAPGYFINPATGRTEVMMKPTSKFYMPGEPVDPKDVVQPDSTVTPTVKPGTAGGPMHMPPPEPGEPDSTTTVKPAPIPNVLPGQTPTGPQSPGMQTLPVTPTTPPAQAQPLTTQPAQPISPSSPEFKPTDSVGYDPRFDKYYNTRTGQPITIPPGAPDPLSPDFPQWYANHQASQPGSSPGFNAATGVATTKPGYIQQGPVTPPAANAAPGTTGPLAAAKPATDFAQPIQVPDIAMPATKSEDQYTDELFSKIREMFTVPVRQTSREKGLQQASLMLALTNALTNAVNYKFANPVGQGAPVIKTDNKYVFNAINEEGKLRDLYHAEQTQYNRDLQSAGMTAMQIGNANARNDKEMLFRKGLAEAEMQYRSAESANERAFRAEQADKLFGNQKEIMKLENGYYKEKSEDQFTKQKELENLRHGLAMAELNLKMTSDEKKALLSSIFDAQKELNKDSFQVADSAGNQYSMPPAVYWDVARNVMAKLNADVIDNLFKEDYNAQTNAIRLMVTDEWQRSWEVDSKTGEWYRKGSRTSAPASNAAPTGWWTPGQQPPTPDNSAVPAGWQ